MISQNILTQSPLELYQFGMTFVLLYNFIILVVGILKRRADAKQQPIITFISYASVVAFRYFVIPNNASLTTVCNNIVLGIRYSLLNPLPLWSFIEGALMPVQSTFIFGITMACVLGTSLVPKISSSNTLKKIELISTTLIGINIYRLIGLFMGLNPIYDFILSICMLATSSFSLSENDFHIQTQPIVIFLIYTALFYNFGAVITLDYFLSFTFLILPISLLK